MIGFIINLVPWMDKQVYRHQKRLFVMILISKLHPLSSLFASDHWLGALYPSITDHQRIRLLVAPVLLSPDPKNHSAFVIHQLNFFNISYRSHRSYLSQSKIGWVARLPLLFKGRYLTCHRGLSKGILHTDSLTFPPIDIPSNLNRRIYLWYGDVLCKVTNLLQKILSSICKTLGA